MTQRPPINSAFALALALASCLWAPPNARGLSVAPAPISVLAEEALAIVHGVVVARQTEPRPGAPLAPITWVTIEVLDAAAWPATPTPGLETDPDGRPRRVTLLIPGGIRGTLKTVVPGIPRYAIGMEAIWLLGPVPGGVAPIGYGLGTLAVSPDGFIADPRIRADKPKDVGAELDRLRGLRGHR